MNINRIVIPKSGCNNNRAEIMLIDVIDQIQPGKFFFSAHNESTQALKIMNKGLHTSLGWKLIFPI